MSSASGLKPDELTFRVNTTSTYNVFAAAPLRGLRRVVWASSETTLGLPFERKRPRYAPIDEEHPPLPEFSYALSKLLGEEMARQFSRWNGVEKARRVLGYEPAFSWRDAIGDRT